MVIQIEKKKDKKHITIVFAVIGFMVLFLLWRFLFTRHDVDMPIIPVIKEVPRIDFEYLESSAFRQFYAPDVIDPLPIGTMGRSNPFLPYR